MPIQIEINEAYTELLVEFYLKRLKALRDEIVEREKEMKDITQTIQKLKKKTPSEAAPDRILPTADYSDKWPWVKKIEFAISYKNSPLTTKEIVDVLTEFEPSFIFERKRVVASISSTLSTKYGDGQPFVRIQRESGEFAYHLQPEEDLLGFSVAEPEPEDLPF